MGNARQCRTHNAERLTAALSAVGTKGVIEANFVIGLGVGVHAPVAQPVDFQLGTSTQTRRTGRARHGRHGRAGQVISLHPGRNCRLEIGLQCSAGGANRRYCARSSLWTNCCSGGNQNRYRNGGMGLSLSALQRRTIGLRPLFLHQDVQHLPAPGSEADATLNTLFFDTRQYIFAVHHGFKGLSVSCRQLNDTVYRILINPCRLHRFVLPTAGCHGTPLAALLIS